MAWTRVEGLEVVRGEWGIYLRRESLSMKSGFRNVKERIESKPAPKFGARTSERREFASGGLHI